MIPLLVALPALGVIPQFWEVRSYDEFREGELNGLSITSDGELVLAPRFDILFDTDETLIFSAVADSAGAVYLGTGHDGKVYRVGADGNGTLLADLPELDVLALALDTEDGLFAATSPDGKVYRIGPDGSEQVFFDPEDKYVWSLLFDEMGSLFVATGDEGVIYRVAPDGTSEVFYDSEETHIITMAFDATGNLIAGGNPKGYVYRISDDGRPFVLYDSGMQEVHSLALAADGTIYAAVVNSSGAAVPPQAPATAAPTTDGTTVSVTVGPAAAAQQPQARPAQQGSGPGRGGAGGAGRRAAAPQGALLEVRTDGVVTTVWQSSSEMIFALLPHDEGLFFSTGTKGRIYNYEGPRRTTLVVESSEEQTTQLLVHGTRVYASSSNAGKLFELSNQVAGTGFYESKVRNTGATSSWGKVSWRGGTGGVEILTRTGNTGSPDSTWSDWAPIGDSGEVFSPNARFIQWKAVLDGVDEDAPLLSSVRVPYLQQNFRPDVTSLVVLPPGVSLQKVQTTNNAAAQAGNGSGNAAPRIPPRRLNQKGARSLQWTATDRNNDTLTYSLHYKAENEAAWKVLQDGLEDAFYTVRSDMLPDGTYVFRVVASDGGSNPAEIALAGERETAPFAIDNSPPSVTMREEGIENRRVRLHVEVEDQTSTLKQAEVSVDAGNWRPIFPVDGIVDSLSEVFEFSSIELTPGEHTVAFRIYDQNENVGMGKTIVRIP